MFIYSGYASADMASSGMMTTGRVVVVLGGADEEGVLANDDALTRVGVIHWQGILSEALVSLGSGTAGSMTDDGAGTTDDDKPPPLALKREVVQEG